MNEQAPQPLAAETDEDATAFYGIGDPGALEAFFAETPEQRAQKPKARPATPVNAAGEAALMEAYRTRGFLKAKLDPLGLTRPPPLPELAAANYGLIGASAHALVNRLEKAYCGSIGWEIGHIHDATLRRWLVAEAEAVDQGLPDESQRSEILDLLARAVAFEAGMAQRYPGGRMFGLGGAETFLVALEATLAESARLGVEEVVIGGMHRGRFNMLANVLGKPIGQLVAEVLGSPAVPDGLDCSSDVSYHLGYSGDLEIAGRRLHISTSPHPSHLQLAPIISQGRARAKQAARGARGPQTVLPLLLHTDASFAGQGLVAEMLQLSGLPPFHLGGTIHVVINNQLGFTTTPDEGRTARAPTDIARLVEAPVLHVNADAPEAVWRAALVAANWRSIFGRDVIIDLVCYRRPGHNEIDEPRFTQPMMYKAIDARPPIDQIYEAQLQNDGRDVTAADLARTQMSETLAEAFRAAKSWKVNQADWFEGAWKGLRSGSEADMLASVPTGVHAPRLKALGTTITTPPSDFTVDGKVTRFLDERRRSILDGTAITWATAEALALASLVAEGTPIRFGGQDSVRGAFTQRHLEVHDQTTGRRHMLIQPAAAEDVAVEIHNTPLIEHAIVCYEYGVSLADPRRLVVWEAQFGEFLNYAQAVFDQGIACGEDRWLRASGLVILLPHGLDGGGPDHSTARPERLLAACAGANLQVVNASTPANYFHALRRQMHRPFRKPLVVLSPKALLRHKACVSDLADLAEGSAFQHVIAEQVRPSARRVVLCTGKVYYELDAERTRRGLEDKVALVRIEQLHPLPASAIVEALAPTATPTWCGAKKSRKIWATSPTWTAAWSALPDVPFGGQAAPPSPRRPLVSNIGMRRRSKPTSRQPWADCNAPAPPRKTPRREPRGGNTIRLQSQCVWLAGCGEGANGGPGMVVQWQA
ncbi:MAG: 2-oxoglutarate dehydrogenase E1 component [Hyphomicrobiaceae bacterium]